jgi:amino acid transporter
MGVASKSGGALQYDVVSGTGFVAYDIRTQTMGSGTFAIAATAISNIIYAYGGATMYVELMSEMKNPRDFFKSLLCAEGIIMGCYFLFGLVFYAEQGQYVQPIPQSTLVNDTAQKTANILSLITLIIAAVMYGNVGLKVIYYQMVVDTFHGPQLNTRRGTFLWLIMATAYWWIAFVIAGSVPNIQSIVGVVGSLCIMQFTYTFPPLMQFAYYWSQGRTLREKLTDKWWLKSFDLIIALGSLAGKSCACCLSLFCSCLSS